MQPAMTATPLTSPQQRVGRRVQLELTGVDHPGIIHRTSTALSAFNMGIDEFETHVFAGSMSRERMFETKAEIVFPKVSRRRNCARRLKASPKGSVSER
jgi:glycine cleavage system regulatory protein